MAAPRTKEELLAQTAAERDALQSMLRGFTREQMVAQGAYGWSARDYVAHLAEWERLLFGWYDAGLRGETPALPAPGYTWATIADLNQAIYERRRGDPLERVMADWGETSRRLLELIQSISEADLFAPRLFAWTGRGTLGFYIYECGANHYRWAAKEIRLGLRPRR
jgi:hypothetical protein